MDVDAHDLEDPNFWKQNRKDKQYPLPPNEEADTASFGDPQ